MKARILIIFHILNKDNFSIVYDSCISLSPQLSQVSLKFKLYSHSKRNNCSFNYVIKYLVSAFLSFYSNFANYHNLNSSSNFYFIGENLPHIITLEAN